MFTPSLEVYLALGSAACLLLALKLAKWLVTNYRRYQAVSADIPSLGYWYLPASPIWWGLDPIYGQTCLNFINRVKDRYYQVGLLNITFGSVQDFLIADPDIIKALSQGKSAMNDKIPDYQVMDLFGPSLLTANGQTWQHHARIVKPVFNSTQLAKAGLAALKTYQAKLKPSLLNKINSPYLGANSDGSYWLNNRFIMKLVTLDVFRQAGFNLDDDQFVTRLTNETSQEPDIIDLMLDTLSNLSLNYLVPKALQWEEWPVIGSAFKTFRQLDQLLDQMIEVRQRELGQDPEARDLLSTLLKAQGEEKLTPQEVKSEIFLFLLAGLDTTSTLLQNTLKRLAYHPDWQVKLQAEVDQLPQDLDQLPAEAVEEVFEALPLIRGFLKEVLRLHAPVRTSSRVITKKTKVTNRHDQSFTLPKGSRAWLMIRDVNKLPDVYQSNLAFRPDRQDPEPSCGFASFSFGLRRCPGERFSQIESVFFLAALLKDFKVEFQAEVDRQRTTEDFLFWSKEEQVATAPANLPIRLVPR